MPTVLRVGPYVFYFYAADCAEKPHVHVDAHGHTAKFWLNPVALFSNAGFNSRELRRIQEIIEDNQTFLLEKWNEFCNQ